MASVFASRIALKGHALPIGGLGFISGAVPGLLTVNGAPASREIRVCDRMLAVTYVAAFSAADGTYLFRGLDPLRLYDVSARDWQGIYNDTTRTRVKPVL